jgi:HD-GYP domain-containing protein (c-di-GMP phosphodiesterase class II)
VSDAPEPATETPPEETPEAEEQTQHQVVALWLPQAARVTFADEGGVTVTEEPEHAATASMILLSTRVPGDRIGSIVGELRSVTDKPIVVVVHTGASEIATKLLSDGATTVIGEGNVAAAHALLGSRSYEESALESFAQQLGRDSGSSSGIDGSVNQAHLLGADALESRLMALTQTGIVPRLGFVRVSGFARSTRRLSMDAADLLRRRFSMQYQQACSTFESQLYLIGDGEFAVVAEALDSAELDELGGQLAAITTAYSPDPQAPLAFSMGHAGPEAASDTVTLREIAMRGVEFGELKAGPAVVSADSLTRTLAAASELEAIQGVAKDVESRLPHPIGHVERVTSTCHDIADFLGFGGRAAMRLRFAAELHLIGLAVADDELMTKLGQESAMTDPAFLNHPAVGANMVRAAAGDEVASIIEAQLAHWDGTGTPEGLGNQDLPVGARILHAALRITQWSTVNGSVIEWPAPDAIERVVAGSETEFDPAIVEAVSGLWGA